MKPTPAFQQWFGDSKVVDDAGVPLVVYHGTTSSFNVFSFARVRRNQELGVFTSADPVVAINYAESGGGNVMPLYLSIKNPYAMGNDERMMMQVFGEEYAEGGVNAFVSGLMESGYDGIYVPGERDGQTTEEQSDQWIAFSPNQIKSAVGNIGTFDASNPDIRFSLADQNEESDTNAEGPAP
jgi:hypothetical protein